MDQNVVEAVKNDLGEKRIHCLSFQKFIIWKLRSFFVSSCTDNLVIFLGLDFFLDICNFFLKYLCVQTAQIENYDIEELHDVMFLGIKVRQNIGDLLGIKWVWPSLKNTVMRVN